jgi:hypothetical protein
MIRKRALLRIEGVVADWAVVSMLIGSAFP